MRNGITITAIVPIDVAHHLEREMKRAGRKGSRGTYIANCIRFYEDHGKSVKDGVWNQQIHPKFKEVETQLFDCFFYIDLLKKQRTHYQEKLTLIRDTLLETHPNPEMDVNDLYSGSPIRKMPEHEQNRLWDRIEKVDEMMRKEGFE